jgi:putative hydrolase of the HAD superfamily
LIRAVLFDWGGTLTTFHDVDLIDAWRVAAEVLAPDRVDEVAKALLAAEQEVWGRTASSMRSARTAEVLRSASAAVGLPVEDALHLHAVERYLDHWAPVSRARVDAREVLHGLRERGLRTGLLSNTHWPRAQHEEWLARDGLLDLLDVRVYTSDIEHVKPHPEAFGALLEAVGVPARDAVFVGDRMHDDVAGAQRLGMRAVWMRNDATPRTNLLTGGAVEPHATIDQLGQLLGVVDGWLAAG